MKIRKVYLLKDDTFTAARTKVLDINVADPIQSIDILVEMTNGAAMTEASIVKPHDEFTAIELIDGADVLESASMEEWQALNFAERGKLPLMQLTLEDGAVQQEMCHINFGLGPDDVNHYFDPKRFTNPQLRLTNAFTTAAATSWAAAGHQVTVIANVIEEGAGEYQGFLSSKSIYGYTAVDGAIEVVDIQRDFSIRLLQLQALKTAYAPQSTIEKIKLTCDADKFVALDIDADHQVFDNVKQFGPAFQLLLKRMTAATSVLYGDLYYGVWAEVGGGTTLYVSRCRTISGEAVTCESLAQT